MTAARTRVAVVGAGFIADFHLAILQRLPYVQVVAVVDPAEARAAGLARRYGVAHHHASVNALLAEQEVDAAHVLVPPHLHGKVAEPLLRHGVAVLLEKPLATTAAEARQLVELARQHDAVLAVNHNNLFHPSFVAAKERLRSGRLGHLQHVFACLHVPLRQLSAGDFRHWMFQDPRNIVFEQGPHPFSQVRDLLGDLRQVTTVAGGQRELLPGLPFYDTWQIAAEFERGPATFLLSFGKDFAESWLHLIGQDGALRVDLLRSQAMEWYKTPWLEFYDQFAAARGNALRQLGHGLRGVMQYVGSTLKLCDRTDVFYVGMRESLRSFHQSLRSRRSPRASGVDGLAVVECASG